MDHLLSGGPLLGGVNDIIRALPSAPHPSLPVGARLLNFVEAWSAITKDSWALSILRIKTAKRTSWQQYVSKLNFRTPAKKIWDMIRKITGKK